MATLLEQQLTLFDIGGPVCQKCKREIGDKRSIQAAGFSWHATGCFTCSFCSSDITESFVQRYSRVFCLHCEKKLFGQYCGEILGNLTKQESNIGCSKLITDEFLQANDRYYHPSCLCCSKCKRQSNGELFAYSGQFLCKQCSHAIKKS